MESKIMAKKNEMTHDDLMQLPNDIAGMVLTTLQGWFSKFKGDRLSLLLP